MYGLTQKTGMVTEIIKSFSSTQIVKIKFEEKQTKNEDEECTGKAFNYTNLTGRAEVGNRVLVNTTGVELSLGTGGYHFVVCIFKEKEENIQEYSEKNHDFPDKKMKDLSYVNSLPEGYGHIMKMRYTPFQIMTRSVEEQESPYHQLFKNDQDLNQIPVVILPLHSLLSPLILVFKSFFPEKKITYIMSEGGSLSLDFSLQVNKLKEKKLLDNTITIGHAFGGDLEAVNIFTGLMTAAKVVKSDLVITAMGPGIAGTATPLGHSGVENAFINYAVDVLNGRSIVVPRISTADKRKRHYLLSHHSITLLKKLINNRVEIAVPENKKIKEKLSNTGILNKHKVFSYKYRKIKEILYKSDFTFNSMGRKLEDDPLFFVTGALPVLRYQELMKER
ncbi:MAG: DUF3866 family protein [Bacillota bacterium]